MDQRRLAALYRRHGPAAYARCCKLLRDEALAEDAVQEVFIRVLRHLDKAPDDDAALAWVYRISTNYCLNLLRDRAAQAEPVAELPEGTSGNFELLLADREACLRVLSHLPEKLSAPAVLYYVDGLEQGRVAEVLGISRRTVINRLADFTDRARKYFARSGAQA